MILLYIFCTIIVLYIFIFFVLARIFVPFMGFGQYNIPKQLPSDMVETIKQLEDESKNSLYFLERVYLFIQNRWHSERARTLTVLPLIFRTDLKEIWSTSGYAHCTTINYIFVSMLANSKFFTQEDIQIRHRFFNGVPHQYVRVKVDGGWLDADPSVTYLHLPLGKRTHKLFG